MKQVASRKACRFLGSAYSSTLNMETTCFSVTSVNFLQTTRCYIAEDTTLRIYLDINWIAVCMWGVGRGCPVSLYTDGHEIKEPTLSLLCRTFTRLKSEQNKLCLGLERFWIDVASQLENSFIPCSRRYARSLQVNQRDPSFPCMQGNTSHTVALRICINSRYKAPQAVTGYSITAISKAKLNLTLGVEVDA